MLNIFLSAFFFRLSFRPASAHYPHTTSADDDALAGTRALALGVDERDRIARVLRRERTLRRRAVHVREEPLDLVLVARPLPELRLERLAFRGVDGEVLGGARGADRRRALEHHAEAGLELDGNFKGEIVMKLGEEELGKAEVALKKGEKQIVKIAMKPSKEIKELTFTFNGKGKANFYKLILA